MAVKIREEESTRQEFLDGRASPGRGVEGASFGWLVEGGGGLLRKKRVEVSQTLSDGGRRQEALAHPPPLTPKMHIPKPAYQSRFGVR